jgi:hypothetical protein
MIAYPKLNILYSLAICMFSIKLIKAEEHKIFLSFPTAYYKTHKIINLIGFKYNTFFY